MKEGFSKKEIEQFYDDQVKIANQYCEIYGISPKGLVLQVYKKVRQEIDDSKKDEFASKIVSDPIALRILFIVNTPPEDFERRVKLYNLSSPIQDHRCLLLLAKYLRGLGWEKYLRSLAHDFMVNLAVDFQKLSGRLETIAELRETHERITELEHGTQKWEIDLWPKARVILLVRIKDNKVAAHFYSLQDQSHYEFNNFVDEFMIGWMQDFDVKKLRDDAYEFQKGHPEVLIYLYDREEKLLEKFPFALKEKYKPLLKYQAKIHPLQRFPDQRKQKEDKAESKVTDADQEAELAFFQSIFKYTNTKGPPSGYFKLEILSQLYKEYQRAKEKNQFESVYPDEDVQGEPKSDFALVEEALADLQIKDPIDKIIAKNYWKSRQMIADIVYETLGKRITKQAIEKRWQSHILPMIKAAKTLEIRRIIAEDEKRRGYEPSVDKTIEEIEEEDIREKFESRLDGQPESTGKEEEEQEE